MAGAREYYEEIPSTQDRAIALARDGAAEGTRVVARVQSAGRGRLDHGWSSPPGGLYLSVVLASPPDPPTLLPLALGARLAEELGHRFGRALRVKWPNDVLALEDPPHAPRKLAGILIDRVPSPLLGWAAVAGIGVNVAPEPDAFPPELRREVARLSTATAPVRPGEVEELVVAAALAAARDLRAPERLGELHALLARLLYGVGRRATVDGQTVGRIVGLTEDGALEVEEGGRRMAIRTGDLRVVEDR